MIVQGLCSEKEGSPFLFLCSYGRYMKYENVYISVFISIFVPCKRVVYECMTIKQFFSFKHNRYLWLNLIAMVVVVIAALFGALKWLDGYTRHGMAVVVPDVKGLSVEQAIPEFQAHGLVCEVSDSTYVKTQPAGSILDYTPGAGQKVKQGRLIRLTINTLSVPLMTVPDVADNSSLRQAEARLLASGFKLDSVQLVPGEKDWVYSVKYQDRELLVGDKVPMGAILTLVAGDGGELPKDSLTVDEATGQPLQPTPAPQTGSATDDDWF